jgi:uncharacterized sulfatase
MYLSDRKPNVVFVVLDTHRWDRLGCYGYPRGTSPNLDAFAEEATLFERGIAPAQWTIPSHASLFSGEPPSVHGALQSDDVLHPRFRTLAERLREEGYRTVGFCNNPLVGILDNGLRRGFDAFYNYAGAFPSGPNGSASGGLLGRAWHALGDSLRRIALPIQNAFANSNMLFQGALDPFWVPIWTWIANFKGNTPRSIRDVTRFVERQTRRDYDAPYFLFVNLMETHLPYTPPRRYLDALAPSYDQERTARDFVRDFNRRAADWFTPPKEPFSELEAEALGQMYDAEVAYQDHLLAQLLEALDRPEQREETMVILVGDHGEMLGEHRLMGHAFGVFEELIHVPLLIRSPGQTRAKRVADPVSVTRLFHTTLQAAGVPAYENVSGEIVEVEDWSLPGLNGHERRGDPSSVVVSEAYAPTFAVNVMEARKRALIDELHCRATHRAAYSGEHKLISIEGVENKLFSLRDDPREIRSLNGEGNAARIEYLIEELGAFVTSAGARRPDVEARRATNADDAMVQQRLRDLGYLE